MNFDEIVETVKGYLIDLPTETVELVPVLVNEAIKKAERRYNFRHMKRQLEAVTVVNIRELADVPVNWKEDRVLPFSTDENGFTGEIDWAPSQSDMVRQYSDNPTIDVGVPQFILNFFDEIEDKTEYRVYPFPDGQSNYTDGEYRLTLPYYAFTGDLSGAENNFITRENPFYVIFKAVSDGLLFNRDEARAAPFDRLAERQFRELKNQDKRTKLQRRNELTIRLGANNPARRPRAPFRR